MNMDDINLTKSVMVIPTKWHGALSPLDLIPCPTVVTYKGGGYGPEMRTETTQHQKESLNSDPYFVYCMKCLSVLSING